MTIDSSSKEPGAPRPDWRLPRILDVKIRRIPYQAPKLRHFESYLAKYKEAIEFLVKTDGPFPIRALSPVLYVGDAVVREVEGGVRNVYRFLAFEFDQLKEGSPISLAWPGQSREQWIRTKFKFRLTEKGEKKGK